MAASCPLFADEEHAALQATNTVTNYTMLHFRKLVQMCTVKIESGLGYKSSQVRVQVQVQVQV